MNNSKEEKEYLEKYNIEDFDRPSLTVDIALFSIIKDRPAENIRKLDKNELKILLIKRGTHPYKDYWALPGGFCKKYENVIDAAKRELREETNVQDTYITIINAYGKENRDPRGWIVSNTFLSLVDASRCHLKAGSDAWESQWFTVSFSVKNTQQNQSDSIKETKTIYELNLKGKEDMLSCEVEESIEISLNHENTDYKILNSDLAFDHAEIILNAILRLRKEIEYDKSMIFNIMPRTFTMAMLEDAFSLILGKKIIKTNFNRDMAKYVEETGEIISDKAHRPSKVFKRKL